MKNTIQRPSWDEIHMLDAIRVATRSSCLKRAVGAALVRDNRVIATGYNGAAPGIVNCLELRHCFYEGIAYQDFEKGLGTFESLKEQRKHLCIAVHAEANALAQCAKFGQPSVGTVLYVTNFPCPQCVQNEILAKGVREIKVWKEYLSNSLITLDEQRASEAMLFKAGVPFGFVHLSPKRLQELFQLMEQVGERTQYRFSPNQMIAQDQLAPK